MVLRVKDKFGARVVLARQRLGFQGAVLGSKQKCRGHTHALAKPIPEQEALENFKESYT